MFLKARWQPALYRILRGNKSNQEASRTLSSALQKSSKNIWKNNSRKLRIRTQASLCWLQRKQGCWRKKFRYEIFIVSFSHSLHIFRTRQYSENFINFSARKPQLLHNQASVLMRRTISSTCKVSKYFHGSMNFQITQTIFVEKKEMLATIFTREGM